MEITPIDYQDPHAAKLLSHALHHTGFGLLKNHTISHELTQKMYADWQVFFASDTKHDYPYDKKKQDGYFSLKDSETAQGYDQRDLKEYFHVYPWGRYPNSVGPEARQLFKEMNALAKTLLQWIGNGLPADNKQQLSMPLSDMITDSAITLLRVLHYPPLTGDEPTSALRAAAHRDINLLTLLPSATQSGLQLQDNAGKWHDAPNDTSTMVIFIGDMLQFLSKNYYLATNHQVLNPGPDLPNVSRLSLPFFLCPRPEIPLKKGFTAQYFLEKRMEELGVLNLNDAMR